MLSVLLPIEEKVCLLFQCVAFLDQAEPLIVEAKPLTVPLDASYIVSSIQSALMDGDSIQVILCTA